VFDIDDLSVDEIRRLFPEGRVFRDDYRDGRLIWFGEGRDAPFWFRPVLRTVEQAAGNVPSSKLDE